MKVDRRSDLKVHSTMQGEEIKMGFDDNAAVHLMSILTDLYSDPELAILREYSTNALDAHKEAGVSKPIEVSLPTPLAPFLRIKDYGIGMDEPAIRNIYSKYGASTKRDTNEQVGMLGLGCKSALTYTDQFTLVGVKDGYRVAVAISRDDEGRGAMTVVESGATDQPNGVEVVIPVKRHNEIERKARHFFSFWQQGTVLVNGNAPTPLDSMKLTDRIYVAKNLGQDYLVMGNVPYPAKQLKSGLNYSFNVVAYVDIGEINFTPAREDLHYTPKTERAIQRVQQEVTGAIQGAVQREVDNAGTKAEAVAKVSEWRQIHRTAYQHNYTYKGATVPTEWTCPLPAALNTQGPNSTHDHFHVVPSSSYVMSRTERPRQLASDHWPRSVFFYGYDKAKFTPTHKKKLLQWAETTDHGREIDRFVLLDAERDIAGIRAWLAAGQVFAWADVQAQVLPKKQRLSTGSGRIAGSYDMWIDGKSKYGVPANDIDQKKPLLHYQGNLNQGGRFAAILSTFYPDGFTLVCLPANRVNKYERDLPKSEEVMKRVQSLYDGWSKKIGKETHQALAINDSGDDGLYTLLKPDRLDDPELAKAVTLSRKDLTKVTQERRMFGNVIGRIKTDEGFRDPLDKYPLAAHFSTYRPDATEIEHFHIYLNAAYAANRKGN